LKSGEKDLARSVFEASLPPLDDIGVGDGLGFGDRPWTDSGPTNYPQMPKMRFQINVGNFASYDLTSTNDIYDYSEMSTAADLFIHEMTHVWQYHNGFGVWVSSFFASVKDRIGVGSGYDFTPGESWDSYNVEQQASIVEKWHHNGKLKNDPLYPYIRLVIRSKGNRYARGLELKSLAGDVDYLRGRGLD
jgi:hypothetical protein